MKLWCSFLFVFAFAGAYKSYSGYQVFRTAVLDENAVRILTPLLERPEFDFWARPRVGQEADIMTSPQFTQLLWDTLVTLGLQPSVLNSDVSQTVEQERTEIERIKQSEENHGNRGPSFENFLTYDEIQAYLDEVVAMFPEIATLETIGTSYEGRTMRVLKLSNGPGKTGIWMDAAIHAREWAAPPVALFAINELTENLAVNQAMLDKNDFFFLPVVNPDGYAYSWTDDRFWRKTRSPNTLCIGTDGNRNFDVHWGEGNDGPCSDTFPGTAAFSEPEVKAMSDFLINNPSITFYITLHSYGKYILSPYSYTTDLPPNHDELIRVGDEAAAALAAVRGTRYRVGTSANILYYSYGNSRDWVYDALNISYSYTIELPGGGSGNFNPPPEDILPVVTETWEAIKVFAANIPTSRENVS